jgi:hypothetical protein
VKPGDGEYGRKLGPWHRWSVHELATRFQQLAIASARGEGGELAPVCLAVLHALEAGAMGPIARSALVERLFRHPPRRLVELIGKESLGRRALGLLASATPGTADAAFDDLLAWMILDAQGAIQIGETMLAAAPMKDAIATRSTLVREGLVRRRPTGKTSPCLVLMAHAHHLLETRSPGLALECLELALRFPDPLAHVRGLRVRALHGAGQASRAQALAASALVQEQAGSEDPKVYYEVARYYLELGRLREAIDQLRLYAARDPNRAGLLRFDPRLVPLRALPQFEGLLETIDPAP